MNKHTKTQRTAKNNWLLFSLLIATVGIIGLYPLAKSIANQTVGNITINPDPIKTITNQQPRVEAVFVLDTTGSMGGMIETAKQKIWSIASSMASAQPAPELKIGLVAFRDRGDSYVTQVIDLSSDLDMVNASLMQLQADGGGDEPESVNQALAEAITRISWSPDSKAYKTVFLVGDAPPHLDYADEMQFPDIVDLARDKGIVINAIQCGNNPATSANWQRLASLSQGSFFNVAQAGGGLHMATPYDEQLAALSRDLEDTKIHFGTKSERLASAAKQKAVAEFFVSASPDTAARRATFNATDAGKKNNYGEKDLIEEVIVTGSSVRDINTALLPEPMQAMSEDERERHVAQKLEARKNLEAKIETLSKVRQEYLQDEASKHSERENSLDEQIYSVIREQGAEKGLNYKEDGLRY